MSGKRKRKIGQNRGRKKKKGKEKISQIYRLMGYTTKKKNYERAISRNDGNNSTWSKTRVIRNDENQVNNRWWHTIAHVAHVQWLAHANPACGRNELGPCTND